MMGSKRNDSSTMRATPSANGEARSRRNFSISSSARSVVELRPENPGVTTPTEVDSSEETNPASPAETGVVSNRFSSGTPKAREILLKVPACGLLVLPRSI